MDYRPRAVAEMPRMLVGLALLLALIGVLALAPVEASSETRSSRKASSFNYCGEAGAVFKPRTAFVGIGDGAVQVESPTEQNCTLGQMAAHNLGYVRGAIRWDGVEWAPNYYQWGSVDSYVTALAEHHLRFLPVLIGAPKWESTEPAHGALLGYYPPANPADFGHFAALCVERYGPGGTFWRANPHLPYYPVLAWQIWNEENLQENWEPAPSMLSYVQLLRATYTAIKQVSRQAIVVTGGMPFYGSSDETSYISQMYRAGARGYFDALAIHPYSATLNQAYQHLLLARRLMKRFRNGNKALWVTEFGWAGGNPDGFITNARKQKTQVTKFFGWVVKHRAKLHLQHVFWYGWLDFVPPGAGAPNANWWGYHLGMFTVNQTPKPALSALSAAARRLDVVMPQRRLRPKHHR